MIERNSLVLVPGLLCTRELYAPQIAGLRDLADIVIADHTTAPSIHDIAARILEGAPKQFALCGLSMGGYIAFEIMRQAPDRVTRLALLDTNATADPPDRAAYRRGLVEEARQSGLGAVMEKLVPLFLNARHQTDERLVAIARRMAADTGVEAFARQQEAIITRPDSRPTLPAIRCPTLVLVGRDDVLTPVAAHEVIAAGIAGSRLEILEDSGHLATLEQPERVTAALRGWLYS
jgi:pimeloyl-ACP methyl ester carboxylesterase